MRAAFFGFGLGLLVFSCAPNPPARWAEGGSTLVIAPARWDQDDGDSIEIRANGQVLEDGALLFVIDRVGRVTDEDYEPVAVLLPDGHLAGPDNRSLGKVGVANAAPPGAVQAWLAITPDGRVTYFDPEGERSAGGRSHAGYATPARAESLDRAGNSRRPRAHGGDRAGAALPPSPFLPWQPAHSRSKTRAPGADAVRALAALASVAPS